MSATTKPDVPRSARPTRGRVIMDVVSFVLSWVLIFQQALQPASYHASFLVLAATMSGVPAAVAAASVLIRRAQLPGMAPEPSGDTTSPS